MKNRIEHRLAIDGGPAVFAGGPPCWPPRDEAILAALESVWEDGSWGTYHGPNSEWLIDALKTRFQRTHIQLCSSGTIGVELALRGVGVEPGDVVVLAAYDFPGNFRAVEAIGAKPMLVDIVPNTWCIDPQSLGEVVTGKSKPAGKIRALVVSHLHGGLAPLREIMEIASQHGMRVVEDACQAAGATLEGQPAGSWGDVSVLSFGGSKLLSAGRGGAVLTNDPMVEQRMRVFSDRGNAAFPLSELQAAVLRPQFDKLTARHRRREAQAARLIASTSHLPSLRPLQNRVPGSPAFYKLPWLYGVDRSHGGAGPTREQFLAAVRAEGVALGAGFRGFAKRSAKRCLRVGSLTNSEAAARDTVVMHHPVLLENDETMERVVQAIEKVTLSLR